jgi:hypothetical protein
LTASASISRVVMVAPEWVRVVSIAAAVAD